MKDFLKKSFVPPKITSKVQMRCLNCGCVFRGHWLLPSKKCPGCGSLKTKKDERVRY